MPFFQTCIINLSIYSIVFRKCLSQIIIESSLDINFIKCHVGNKFRACLREKSKIPFYECTVGLNIFIIDECVKNFSLLQITS